MISDDQLTRFSKAREKIVGRVKGSGSLSIQGPQSSEEYLVVMERFPSRTERPSVREPVTNGNHAPIGQAQNNGSSDSQEIPVSMENISLEGTEDQYVTSPNGETLVRNVHVRRSERIRNSLHWYNPGLGAAGEWKNDDVASIVYMIQDRYLNNNIDTHDILSLLARWDAEHCDQKIPPLKQYPMYPFS